MPKLTIDLGFTFEGIRQDYTKQFDVDRDLDRGDLDFLAAQMFRECHMQALYARYRRSMSDFQALFAGGDWFPGDATDLIRMAAHSNTANVWFQIHNTLLEAAHLM